MANVTVSYLWRDQKAHEGYRTGIPLHSHTNQSREALDLRPCSGKSSNYPFIRRPLCKSSAKGVSLSVIRFQPNPWSV
jgi:hypothetical protein